MKKLYQSALSLASVVALETGLRLETTFQRFWSGIFDQDRIPAAAIVLINFLIIIS